MKKSMQFGGKTQKPRHKALNKKAIVYGRAGSRTKDQKQQAKEAATKLFDEIKGAWCIAFTDGSALGNPGPAGSGTYMEFAQDQPLLLKRVLGHSTNNIAELTAIGMAMEEALRRFPHDENDHIDKHLARRRDVTHMHLLTDSQYCFGLLTKGWSASANRELVSYLRLLQSMLGHVVQLKCHWVAGHVGLEGNERANELATEASMESKRGMCDKKKKELINWRLVDKGIVSRLTLLCALRLHTYTPNPGGMETEHLDVWDTFTVYWQRLLRCLEASKVEEWNRALYNIAQFKQE